MGFDKGLILVNGATIAVRTAQALQRVVAPLIEVGPGLSGIASVREDPPGSGPLVAVRAGGQALRGAGHSGPALVLACDLPLLTDAALRMLADWPGNCSVVPVVNRRPQPLFARWSAEDLAAAGELVAGGERSIKALLAQPDVVLVDEGGWPPEVGPSAFADVDTPADLEMLGLRLPCPTDRRGDGVSARDRAQ